MAQVTTRLSTSGMHCSSCSMLIDMTLQDVDGVVESKTDHVSGESTVTYDDTRVSTDGLIEAVRGAGYEAEVIG